MITNNNNYQQSFHEQQTMHHQQQMQPQYNVHHMNSTAQLQQRIKSRLQIHANLKSNVDEYNMYIE